MMIPRPHSNGQLAPKSHVNRDTAELVLDLPRLQGITT
jgi:hypothetical protein